MYWTVIFKISATVLLLTAGLLTIPHALLGVTFKNILFAAAGLSGVMTALSAFKFINMNNIHPESEEDRINSQSVPASKEHPDVHADD